MLAVVWALDLDDADSQSAQYLNSGGTKSDSKGFSIAKLQADTAQNIAGKLAYWTPCMTEEERRRLGCPGGKWFFYYRFVLIEAHLVY